MGGSGDGVRTGILALVGLAVCVVLAIGTWAVHAESRRQTALLLAALRGYPAADRDRATAPAGPGPATTGAFDHADALSRESSPAVRAHAARILVELTDPRAETRLATLVDDPAEEVREAALLALYQRHSPLLRPLCLRILRDGDIRRRLAVAELLHHDDWVGLLDDRLLAAVADCATGLPDRPDHEVRRTRSGLIAVLGTTARPDLCPAIMAAARSTRDAEAHLRAAEALGACAEPDQVPMVAAFAWEIGKAHPDTSYHAVARLVKFLARFPPREDCIEPIGRLLNLETRRNQWADDCIAYLIAARHPVAAPYLIEARLREIQQQRIDQGLAKAGRGGGGGYPGIARRDKRFVLADGAAQKALEKRLAEERRGPRGADEF